MSELANLPELLREWGVDEQGDQLVLHRLLDLMAHHEVALIAELLPPPPSEVRERFFELLHEVFADDVPVDELLFLGSNADNLDDIAASARRWLRTQPARARRAPTPAVSPLGPRRRRGAFVFADAQLLQAHLAAPLARASRQELEQQRERAAKQLNALHGAEPDLEVLFAQQGGALTLELAHERFNPAPSSMMTQLAAAAYFTASGDLLAAEHLDGGPPGDPAMRRLRRLQLEGTVLDERLRGACAAGDWTLACQIADAAWGKLSPRRILSALLELAIEPGLEEERIDLQLRMKLAYPDEASLPGLPSELTAAPAE